MQEVDAVNPWVGSTAQSGDPGSFTLSEQDQPKWTHLQPQGEMNPDMQSPPSQNWGELVEKWRLFSREYWENRAIF